jgi:hypothetical protein
MLIAVSRHWFVPLGVAGWLVAMAPTAALADDDPAGVAFFERAIRPVLVRECYECHSSQAKRLKGGLRLDSRPGLLTGGDSGPALVPGKPDESLLIDALQYDGLEMPPKGKLPDTVIAAFSRWIAMGAPDPRDGRAASVAVPSGINFEAGRAFWSYKLPRRHKPPVVHDCAWPLGDVDCFLLAVLESQGQHPVADADKATLLRRVSFDLVGLPPTPEQIDAFLNDEAPDAFEHLVDGLLASPAFGERWGRHWLDVTRFGESLTLRGMIFKEAWRYRDYVIDAFNADRPFDQLIREQIAGDLLPAASLDERRRQRVATAFLVLGNTNLEEQDKAQLRMDVVDEQLDTIGKAFLAQTLGCARCHDHKFDPIPTRDYYALAGILRNTRSMEHANVSKWLEMPLPVSAEAEAVLRAHDAAVAALETRIKQERGRVGSRKAGGVLAVDDVPGIVVDDAHAKKVGAWVDSRHSSTYIGAGYIHDGNTAKGEKTLTFQPALPRSGAYEVWLAYPPAANRAEVVPVIVMSADGERTLEVNMRSEPPIGGRFLSLGRYAFEKDAQSYVLISNEGTKGYVTADAVIFIPAEQIAQIEKNRVKQQPDLLPALEAELRRLKVTGPRREMVMSVVEEPRIEDARVHVRGNVHNLAELAPRGFFRVATYGPVPSFSGRESGRRELADWIASRENPLTARVIVNRVWHWLFGVGIVRTTDNFGTTGEPPSHPELLDELALRFTEQGWSVKTLVRRLVLSHAYRLSTTDDARALAVDAENRLLWRMNRRRLDAECIRDAILSATGRLRRDMGGPSFPSQLTADYGYADNDSRRSVYAPVFRNALPELFEAFDFADPSMVVGRRMTSTVAPQALFLMNHPFVLEQAREAARCLLAGPDASDDGRLLRAYRSTLGRPPSQSERRLALGFIARSGGANPEVSWAIIFQTLFASMDFRYVN